MRTAPARPTTRDRVLKERPRSPAHVEPAVPSFFNGSAVTVLTLTHRRRIVRRRLAILATAALLLLTGLVTLGVAIVRSVAHQQATSPETALRAALTAQWRSNVWGPLPSLHADSFCRLGDQSQSFQPCLRLVSPDGVALTLAMDDLPASPGLSAPEALATHVRVYVRFPLEAWPMVLRWQRELDQRASAQDPVIQALRTPGGPPAGRVLNRPMPPHGGDLRWVDVHGTPLALVRDDRQSPWTWTMVAPLSDLDRALSVGAEGQALAAMARAGDPISAVTAASLAGLPLDPSPHPVGVSGVSP